MSNVSVNFTYEQLAVVTVSSQCSVPKHIADLGEEQVKLYLEEHPEKWDWEEEVLNTDYLEKLGHEKYVITEVGEELEDE